METPKLNRRPLKINNRKSVEQRFESAKPTIKSETRASIFSWASRGRGVQGESVNSSGDVGSKQIISKLRKPM
jgi:hypothetical protein